MQLMETWVGSLGQEDPQGRKWQPTPVFLFGKSHGQRNLEAYSSWSCKQLETTQQLHSKKKKKLRICIMTEISSQRTVIGSKQQTFHFKYCTPKSTETTLSKTILVSSGVQIQKNIQSRNQFTPSTSCWSAHRLRAYWTAESFIITFNLICVRSHSRDNETRNQEIAGNKPSQGKRKQHMEIYNHMSSWWKQEYEDRAQLVRVESVQ